MQWLHLRNLEDVKGDPVPFPDFDGNLVEAFRRETTLFLASTLREDRSVLDLLDADYTFVNERLARHYGIPGVYGSRFRRVDLPDLTQRGGLLGHGGLLALTSYPTRTSPVLRGKWLLDTILGAPPAVAAARRAGAAGRGRRRAHHVGPRAARTPPAGPPPAPRATRPSTRRASPSSSTTASAGGGRGTSTATPSTRRRRCRAAGGSRAWPACARGCSIGPTSSRGR